MSEKMGIHELGGRIGEAISVFIGMSSFETRSLSILRAISNNARRFILFNNSTASDLVKRNLEETKGIVRSDSVDYLTVNLDVPMASAKAFKEAVELIKKSPPGPIFIDITTFSHELLLIFMRALHEAKLERKFYFGYTGAAQYSTNTEPSEVWLSKGVSQIRSILGFPGKILPSKKLHLIVLVGFEHERAKAVIEQFEPNVLTLGIGGSTQSVSQTHFASNQIFFDELKDFVDLKKNIYSQVNTFEFSCVDPVITQRAVLEQVAKFASFNSVICPMNTKISTLGVGLAALENSDLQLCYSRALIYNEAGYSSPSDVVTIFETIL